MAPRPEVVVFDVNETLSNMAAMTQRFAEVGAPQHLANVWFSMLLRDGFALAAAGDKATFGALGESVLRNVFADAVLDRNLDAAVRHVLDGFLRLPLHPDIVDGVHALRGAGFRLVTLTNGSTRVADRLLSAGGIRDEFEALLSVDDAPLWKPARGAYEYAARVCDTAVDEMLLVAVHPWDINGAARAGMTTAWINRRGESYPRYFAEPDYTVATLTDLAGRLGR